MLQIQETIKLKQIPACIACQGCIDSDYKIYIAGRDGAIFLIKNGKLSSSFKPNIDSKPVAMVKLEKTLVIAGMNNNLFSFYNKGRLNFTK
jgi:hypothetical protein